MKWFLIKIVRYIIFGLAIGLYSSSYADESEVKSAVSNFNSDNNASWQVKLRSLKSDKSVKFRILQLGDSHTAGDFFTGALRQRLQTEWGDGGFGWIYPNKVAGQRMANVQYRSTGWTTLTSRRDKADFPLGGVISRSTSGGSVTISPIIATNKLYKITALVRYVSGSSPLVFKDAGASVVNTVLADKNNTSWQSVSFYAQIPLSYQTDSNGSWEVGGINIENNSSGIVLSAMGINGAQLSNWSNWHATLIADLALTNADLVILSYGTNEAFNDRIDISATEEIWKEKIDIIHQALPSAGILIIGAPESLKSSFGECGKRPIALDSMQNMQLNIAIQESTLFWPWQYAMSGQCSMKKWMNQGLARQDGVHFTEKGYGFAANQLANEIIKLAN